MRHHTLLAIYNDYKNNISAKGVKGAICLFIKRFLQQGDIKSLIDMGISKREAIKAAKAIEKIKSEKKEK